MRHIHILNQEERDRLPMGATACSRINFCIGGDWDQCDSYDFCVKDGTCPDTKPVPPAQ
jgi:hypothetical protein